MQTIFQDWISMRDPIDINIFLQYKFSKFCPREMQVDKWVNGHAEFLSRI
jgi:hypothetical protein